MFPLSIRLKIVAATIVCTLLLFLQITPAINWIGDFLSNPADVSNLSVRQVEGKMFLTWDKSSEIDIKSYIVDGFEANPISLKRNVLSTELVITADTKSEFLFRVEDITGNKSSGVKVSLLSTDEIQNRLSNEVVYNPVNRLEADRRSTDQIFKIVILNLVVCILLTLFIIWGSVDSLRSMTLSLYPAVTTSSFVIISLTFLYSENNQANKLFLSMLITLIYGVVLYFIYLTTNILNTSIKVQIPLAQAARASQFIFSLLSSYLILIIFFGSSYTFFEKIVFIVPIIFYLTFASLLVLPHEIVKTAMFKSLGITLTLAFGIFVMSIWPIEYIYAILCIAVCYYILLSISLEVRSTINRYVWVEYTVLALLICIILFTNSYWGINGNLI